MAVKIGSARINEKGTVNGGMAGDQTKGEVSTQDWYLHSKGWIVIRARDTGIREKIARNMSSICANDNIGYCQDHRSTLTTAAQPYGYDASKVTKKVEVDCSEAVRNCVLYAGISVGSFSTANEVNALRNTGEFDVLTDDKYCKKSEYLLRGDILVTKTKGHTVVVLSDGSGALVDSGIVSGRKTVSQIASEVLAGKWGNGADRKLKIEAAGYNYAEVQTMVNEMSTKTSSSVSGQTSTTTSVSLSNPAYSVGKDYTVRASELKVRTGPGTGFLAKRHDQLSTDGQRHDKNKNGCLDKGTVVTCLEVRNVGDDVWLRCASGWIAACYQGKVYVG